MAEQFEIPPTFAPPFIRPEGSQDPTETVINPIWLDWFLRVRETIAPGSFDHQALTGLQGGTATERFHLTNAQLTGLIALLSGGGGGGGGGIAAWIIEDGIEGDMGPPGPAAAPGGSVSQFAVTVGPVPYNTQYAEVTVVNASITPASRIIVNWGNITDADENTPDFDEVRFTAVPAAGSMTVRISCTEGLQRVGGVYKLNYLIG